MALLSTSRLIDNMRDFLSELEDLKDYVDDTRFLKVSDTLEKILNDAEEAKDEAESEDETSEDEDLDDSDE